MSRPFTRREALLLLLAVVGGVCLLFAEPLFGDRTTTSLRSDDPRIDMRPWAGGDTRALEPINPITPDVDGYVVPGMIRARQLVESEAAPYWDDHQLLGYPLAANLPWPLDSPVATGLPLLIEWLTGRAFAPLTLLDIMLALHTALALLLAYRACRKLDVEPAFAAAGALGFAFSTWMWTRWHGPHIVYTTAWWPAQYTALIWMRRGFVRRGIVEGAVVTGLMLLSGFPQVGVILTGLTGLLALLDKELLRPRRLVAVALMAGLGVALAAPELALSKDVFSRSLRADPGVQAATAARGLPPASLLGALLPDAFGHPPDFSMPDAPSLTMEEWLPQRLWWSHDTQNSAVENALYPGMLLLLLLGAVFRRGVDGRAQALVFCAALAVAASILGPGLAERWPAVARLAAGNVKRSLVIVGAALPLAGGLALQALGTGRRAVPWLWGGLLAAALAAAPVLARAIDDPEAPRWAALLGEQSLRQLLLLGAALLSLVLVSRLGRWLPGGASEGDPPLVGRGFAPGAHVVEVAAWRLKDLVFVGHLVRWLPALVLGVDLIALALAFNPFPRQIEPYPSTPSLVALAARPGRVATYGDGIHLFLPSAAATHGIRTLNGIAPMMPTRTAELLGCIEDDLLDMRDPRVVVPFRRLESLTHPLLDLLAVDTLVHADPELAATTGWPTLFASEREGLAALARPTAGPLAFWTGGARVVTDAAERLALLSDRSFRGPDTALLETAPVQALPELSPVPAVPATVDARAHHVQLDVTAPAAGIAVLTYAWDPGWSARLDGEPAPVLVVDHALMGVEVGAGPHRVEFDYAPRWRQTSLVIAGVALLAVVLLGLTVLRDIVRKRRPGSADAGLDAEADDGDDGSGGSGGADDGRDEGSGQRAGEGSSGDRAHVAADDAPGTVTRLRPADDDDPWADLPEGFEPPGMPRLAADLGEFEGQAITIIIPAYDDTPQLRRAIWSIRRTTDLPFQLVVARAKQSVAKNRNLGLSRAKCDLIAFMDDDVLLPPGWASQLVAVLARSKQMGAVSAHLMFSDGSPQTRRADLAPGEFWEITIPGTCFVFSRQRVTGAFFDENYQGSQWEDTDWVWQLHAMGLTTGVCGDVCVVHDHNDAENRWLKQNGEYFRGKWHRLPGDDDTLSISPEGYAAHRQPPLPGDAGAGAGAAPGAREWDARQGAEGESSVTDDDAPADEAADDDGTDGEASRRAEAGKEPPSDDDRAGETLSDDDSPGNPRPPEF